METRAHTSRDDGRESDPTGDRTTEQEVASGKADWTPAAMLTSVWASLSFSSSSRSCSP